MYYEEMPEIFLPTGDVAAVGDETSAVIEFAVAVEEQQMQLRHYCTF